MSNSIHYEAPYHWWGPGPAPSESLALWELIHNGTVDPEYAVLLWAAVANRCSLTIIGGPSGLGKSTLLHTLLPALPPDQRRIYLRGCYETFAFQRESSYSPSATTLLVNEISPHLPIYLWGPAVQRTLVAGGDGCQILATAHGRGVAEFVGSLTGRPLRVPAQLLAAIDLVALLEPATNHAGRRLTELWQLSAARDGVVIDRVRPGDLPTDVTAAQLADARAFLLSIVVPE